MTSTFALTSSPVGVSTPIVEKVTAPPLALTVSSPHLTNTDDRTHDRKRKRDDVFLSPPPSAKKKSRDDVFLSPPPSARTKSSGRRRKLKAKPSAFESIDKRESELVRAKSLEKSIVNQVKEQEKVLKNDKKEERKAREVYLKAEKERDDRYRKDDELRKERTTLTSKIQELKEEIDALEARKMEIQAEQEETHIPTLETVEEKQKQHERSISKVHKSKKALAETKKLLKKPKQIVKERSEHWRFKSGEQVFDEVGLPFSFEAVDELKKDALLCLYRGLKTSGFPRAQHFSLKDTVCLLMVKDICNAVGIEVPDEGIKEEEDPSHARAMELKALSSQVDAFMRQCQEKPAAHSTDPYDSDSLPDEDDIAMEDEEEDEEEGALSGG
jgi:hypothetical protein